MFALILLSGLILAGDAIAQEDTFGHLLCNGLNNARPFSELFSWVAYISGVSAALRGVYHLKAHADNPGGNKLAIPLMYFFGAMCLLALPHFIGTIVNSLFNVSSGSTGGLGDCTPGEVTGGQPLDRAMESFIENIKDPLILVTSITAMLAGLVMVISGLMKASKAGTDPKSFSPKIILANVGFGAMLLMIGENLNMLLESVFGERDITDPSTINWTLPANTNAEQFTVAVGAALTFVQLIGAIAFVRGWLILKKIVEGTANEPLAKALTHIIGGVLCVNIALFLDIMDRTFGTNFIDG